ncbi:hypothetical protein FH972_015454 [Carpinus fangiana]|uniref:DUF7731 domain-containing protein n=1 Tax=Carpinus fangiana TaxID=176857 RepID=A0A5N6RG72_9ROSI|nr:hypothetical protein FH972_015454 [Carpinus fangiana]
MADRFTLSITEQCGNENERNMQLAFSDGDLLNGSRPSIALNCVDTLNGLMHELGKENLEKVENGGLTGMVHKDPEDATLFNLTHHKTLGFGCGTYLCLCSYGNLGRVDEEVPQTGSIEYDLAQITAKALLCFNNKYIYSSYEESYRLSERGNLNVPPQSTDEYCGGPCLAKGYGYGFNMYTNMNNVMYHDQFLVIYLQKIALCSPNI